MRRRFKAKNRLSHSVAAAVSMSIAVAAAIAWQWSLDAPRVLSYVRAYQSYSFILGNGRVAVAETVRESQLGDGWDFRSIPKGGTLMNLEVDRLNWRHRCGFAVNRIAWLGRGIRSTTLVAPIWTVIAAALVLPAREVTRWWRRRRRHPSGSCQNCGYDLRASPDRCPECGSQRQTS